jgi:RHS repeat-associated protein
MPFGEEIIGLGNRVTQQGYSVADGVRQKFTQKERDTETKLDYFYARYYSSTHGRFTSVDPENTGAHGNEPQSWNAYSYVMNNPLRYIDPDGMRWAQVSVTGGTWYEWFDDKEKDDNGKTAYDRAIAAGYSAVTFDESKPFSWTTGIFAPGETVTTTTLNPDNGTPAKYTHTVTKTEYAGLLLFAGLIDALAMEMSGEHPGALGFVIGEGIKSITGGEGGETNATIDLPNVPEPAVGMAKGGKQNKKDSGLAKESDADISRKARDKSLSPAERKRYQTEEKARGLRNKEKRKQQ